MCEKGSGSMRVRDKVRERMHMALSESNGSGRMKENLFEREEIMWRERDSGSMNERKRESLCDRAYERKYVIESSRIQ